MFKFTSLPLELNEKDFLKYIVLKYLVSMYIFNVIVWMNR